MTIQNRDIVNEAAEYQIGICRDLRRICTIADVFDTNGLDHVISFVIDQFPARVFAEEDGVFTDEWNDFVSNIPYMDPDEILDWLICPEKHFRSHDT